jgi:glycosyl transferase family 1
MRIFLSCQQALKPHAVPAYAFWEYYFRNALGEAGHEILQAPEVDWAEGLMPLSKDERAGWLERTWTKTVDFIRDEHGRKPIDMFLGYLFPLQVDPSAIREILAAGVPTVNFFCDNVREFDEVPAAFRDFSLNWVPEADARAMYAAAGLPYIHSPMAMWVPPRYRTIPDAENEDVVFIGSHDILREDLLGEAESKGLRVQIYGSGWLAGQRGNEDHGQSAARKLAGQLKFMGREGIRGVAMRATYQFREKRPREWIEKASHEPIGGDAYFKATRDSQVVIGINRCPSFRRSFSNPLRYSRLRDIEAPMLGACYLTEMAPGLEDLYEVGTEIEAFRDASELVEKTRLLQRDPAKRLRLRQSGQRRALADHTVGRSLERIAQKLGLSR